MRRAAVANLTATLLLSSMPVLADDAPDPFARDLLIMAEWFEGEFDNEEQLWFHQRSRAEGEPPVRIHTIHKRIDNAALGDIVFYVEEYRDNNPAEVIRQRVVTMDSDPLEEAIRIRQGFLSNAGAVRGAHEDPAKAALISMDTVTFMAACDVFMRRVADQFQGGMKPKDCVFGEGEERRYSVHDLVLSETKYWRTDATFLLADGSFYRGTPLNEPTELRRSRIYFCDFYFYGSDRSQQVVNDLRVFSQGGSATAVRESDGQSFDILLREKEYPYYESRPDFIYYSIRRTGENRSVAFGVADPRSRQFGLNNGELAAFCHLDGYEFQELLEEL